MPDTFYIGQEPLNFEQIDAIVQHEYSLELSEPAEQRIEACRRYLTKTIDETETPIYGVNTGFGALCDTTISSEQLTALQENLVRSHACGTGDIVPLPVVRLLLLLKIHELALGHSGVRKAVVQRLITFYNNDILPVIYEQGSLGASGDLAPLAHMALPLIGEGEVYYQGNKSNAAEVLKKEDLSPLTLQAKEGLALLNGTHFMKAYASWSILELMQWLKVADMTAALSLDAFNCRLDPFHQLIQQVRRHGGQSRTAQTIQQWLRQSELSKVEKEQVQDPYAFRCIPQVHGASKQTFEHAHQVMHQELNAVTDNPNIFPQQDKILSGGNFHGESLALCMDYLAMGVAELGNISERRTYKLLCGDRDLPGFLIENPGVHSGLMIPQYTAASIVSQNKQLCTPASIDSITSSQGQEDHVSMGANAGTKLYRIVTNLKQLIAIEFFAATQAFAFRRPRQTAPALESIIKDYREAVPFVEQDRAYYKDIRRTQQFLSQINLTL